MYQLTTMINAVLGGVCLCRLYVELCSKQQNAK